MHKFIALHWDEKQVLVEEGIEIYWVLYFDLVVDKHELILISIKPNSKHIESPASTWRDRQIGRVRTCLEPPTLTAV